MAWRHTRRAASQRVELRLDAAVRSWRPWERTIERTTNRERRILGWMCVLIAVNQLGFGAVIPVLPLFARSFDVSQMAIGATVAFYGLARVVLSVPAAQIADRLGRRNSLALGGLVTAAGNFWCAIAASYAELVCARVLAGAGAGIVLTTGLIVLADITTPAT